MGRRSAVPSSRGAARSRTRRPAGGRQDHALHRPHRRARRRVRQGARRHRADPRRAARADRRRSRAPTKTTPATVKVVDPPGLSAPVLGELRKADALIAVLRDFGPEADPEHDLETIQLELVVADRDHVEKRLERVRTQAKSGDPRLRDEVAELERLLAHVEAGQPLSSYPGDASARARAAHDEAAHPGRQRGRRASTSSSRPSSPSCRPRRRPSSATGRRASTPSCRGSSRPSGCSRSSPAATRRPGRGRFDRARPPSTPPRAIHTDIARGFIRCEVINWRDLVEAGSRAEAARRGLQRLEGKEYVVQDGDVLNVRFNV